MNEQLSTLAGKVFTDGPYQYRIYVRTGDLGDESIMAINIFIENEPPYVGVDLHMFAINRVAEVAGDHMEKSDWMINKVIMEEAEGLGELSSLITGERTTVFGIQSYQSLMTKIQNNIDKKIDFEKVFKTISSRKIKLFKTLDHMVDNITNINGTPISMKFSISGEPKRHADSMLAPSIKIYITFAAYKDSTIWGINSRPNRDKEAVKLNYDDLVEIKRQLKNTLENLSPVDLHSYDTLQIEQIK